MPTRVRRTVYRRRRPVVRSVLYLNYVMFLDLCSDLFMACLFSGDLQYLFMCLNEDEAP